MILRNITSLQIQWPLVQGDVESSQLQRIFQHCDQVGNRLVLGGFDFQFRRLGWKVHAVLSVLLLTLSFQTGDGRVSLQEFRELANSKGDLTLEGMLD